MQNELKKVVNQKVVHSRAGGAAGSILVVEFEDSSYLWVWCNWRIEKDGVVSVTSFDTIEPSEFSKNSGGLIGQMAPTLNNNEVLNFSLTPQYDLVMNFSNNYTLRLFCDIGPSRNDYPNNWEFIIPGSKTISYEITHQFEEIIVEE